MRGGRELCCLLCEGKLLRVKGLIDFYVVMLIMLLKGC